MICEIFALLDKIEVTSGINAKIGVIKNSPLKNKLIQIIKPALDPYMNFRVSENTLPLCENINELKATSSDVEKQYFKLIDDLRHNRLKPQDARNRCIELMSKGKYTCNNGCKWLRRIFVKNLRIGLHRENIEQLYGLKFKKFEVHLAVDTLGLTKHIEEFEKRPNDFIMEPKYDGLRMITIFDNNNILFYTRNGRQLYNLGDIETELQKQIKHLNNYVLDGEVYARNWNETASIVRSSQTTKRSPYLTYYVFDILPKDIFIKRGSSQSQKDRKVSLRQLLKPDTHIKIVRFLPARSKEFVMAFYKNQIKQGLEGAMLKDLKAIYKFGRSKDWLKVKQVHTIDVICINVIEGTGAARGKLGAIVVKYKNVTSKVGSGFTDKQRLYFWQHPNEIVGHYVEVAYQEITKNGKIRFGRFIRVRYDK